MGGKLRGVRRFEVEVRQAGEGLVIDSPIDDLGTAARVAVAGRLNDFPFESALVPAGGGHVLFVHRALREGAAIEAGDRAVLWLWRIPEPATDRPRRSGLEVSW
jgi:hypothetical protein